MSKVSILTVTALALLLSACGQDAPVPADPGAEAEAVPAPPTEIPANTEVPVQRVESVMITRPDDHPNAVVIMVAGSVTSDGWTEARLVPAATEPSATMRSFQFVATSPEHADAAAQPRPIEARVEFDPFPEGVETIRFVSATNELMAIVGY